MKVYELISKLVKMPAGLNVCIHGLRTVAELENGTEVDVDENGNSIYSVNGSCDDIDSDSEKCVLYF